MSACILSASGSRSSLGLIVVRCASLPPLNLKAYDYVTEVFEPKHNIRYEAFLRARPDGVFLRPVPSMSSFDISKLTISATAPGDHWHLIHRGCTGPFERRCLRCRGDEFDQRCPKPQKVRDERVQDACRGSGRGRAKHCNTFIIIYLIEGTNI